MANIPYAAITYPVSGQTYPLYSELDIATSVTGFTESVGEVNFYLNGVFISKDTSLPYQASYTFYDNGSQILKIVASGVSGTLVTGTTSVTVINDMVTSYNLIASGNGPVGTGAAFERYKWGITLNGGYDASGLRLSKWKQDIKHSNALKH